MKLDLSPPANPPAAPERPGILKRLFKALALLIAVLAVLVAVLIFTVDIDTLREPITTALSDASGLDVNIGELNLDWSGGFGLRADEVSVFSRKGKRTLFSSEAFFLKVKWAPLLDKQVEVEEAVIQKPVFIIQPQAGSLKNVDPSLSGKKTVPLTEKQVGLGPMKRLLMGLHLNAETVKIEDAEILWYPLGGSPDDPLKVRASLILKVDRPEEKRLNIDINDLDLASGPLQLKGKVEARDVLSRQGRFQLKVKGQPVQLQDLAEFLRYLPAQVKKVWNQFDPAGEMTAWSLDSSAQNINLFDEASFRSDAFETKFLFAANDLVLQPPANRPELRQGFPTLKGSVTWSGQKMVHDLEGQLRELPFTAKGNLEFPEKEDAAPLLQTVVRVPKASSRWINEWMPRDWSIEKGVMSHRISIRGKVNAPRQFQVEGVMDGQDWVVGFEKDAHLKIPLTSIKGEWKFKNEQLSVTTLELSPPHGTVQAKAEYLHTDRSYIMDYAGKGLRVEDFYQQNVDGDFVTQGNLVGHIPRRGSPMNAVTGDISFKASSGRFYQLEPIRALLTVLNPLSVAKLNEKGLGYDSLGGDFKIAKGRATTRNLALLSPEMKIYMAGWIDRIVNHVEMQGRFQPSQNLDKAVKSVPILGDILTGGKKGGILESRFKVSGPIKRPKVILDAEGTLIGKGGDILRELGRLPGKLTR